MYTFLPGQHGHQVTQVFESKKENCFCNYYFDFHIVRFYLIINSQIVYNARMDGTMDPHIIVHYNLTVHTYLKLENLKFD